MTFLSQWIEGQRRLRETDLPSFDGEYDVVVCGLGTAGSLAALFCAENSLSVLGVEEITCVGGTHTAGGIQGHYFGCPGGRYEAVDQEVRDFSEKHRCLPAESRKLLVEKSLVENRVAIRYEATVCGVYLQDRTVVGVQVLDSHGIRNYRSRILLDCTGDARIASIAGCETECGRASDGQTQPYTLVSLIRSKEKYRFSNRDFGRVDQYDQESLSQAILFSRAHTGKENASEDTFLAQSPLLGIREGRRIVPEETVRLADLFADRETETPMFYSYADLDKHGWDIAFDGEILGDWAIGANLGAYNVTVAVPYQAILPKDYEGILVPCRALGVDRDVASCVRMILDMKKVAEAAAQWATLCIRQKKRLREIPYEALRDSLRESGCLDERHRRGYRIDGKRNWDGSPLTPQDVTWLTEPEALRARLETEAPGLAIWSAGRLGEAALPYLRPWLEAPDETRKRHAAFAVAITGSSEANGILQQMVAERDGTMLKDCRKNNSLRGAMAIYWLGRLGDRAIVPELIRLISDPGEADRPVYRQEGLLTTRYRIPGYRDLYFQFLSQAVMALIRIGDRHEDLRPEIGEAFLRAFSSGEYYGRITDHPRLTSEGNMAEAIREISFAARRRWQRGS